MKSKIIKGLTFILLPIIQEILAKVFQHLLDFIFEQIKKMYAGWKAQDMEKASTDEEKEAVNKKYAKGEEDLEKVRETVLENIKPLINDAIKEMKIEDRIKKLDAPKQGKLLPHGKGKAA